jgi:putative transposase
MKRVFTDEQIVKILQEAEKGEMPVTALCKKHGLSEQTFYRWRNRFGGMQVKEAQRLRELEKENARLKRLLAERELELDVAKEVIAKKW